MILLTAGPLTDPQLPARASNVYTTDAKGSVASAGWHRPGGIDRVASAGCPPQTKIMATPVLEQAFNRIPRDLIWWCLRKKGVPEEYLQIVQDM